jgi:cephalosporin hydroxylase
MNHLNSFLESVNKNIDQIGNDKNFLELSNLWQCNAISHNYAQNFNWLGRPIIQLPQDIYAAQELIWKVKPDLIIETGIAHGGSLILSASMLALLDYSDAIETQSKLDPLKSKRKVLGIDIDIRKHNEIAIKEHSLSHLIEMIQGSSIAPDIISKVINFSKNYKKIMIFLDSNHTHDHVLEELIAYASLTSKSSYCVVWDTGVEDLPEGFVKDRPWGKGNNPKTAVWAYLDMLKNKPLKDHHGENVNFEIDKNIEYKITITASPDGFLRRV